MLNHVTFLRIVASLHALHISVHTDGRKDGHDQIEYKLNGVGNDFVTALQTSDYVANF